ncbi:MAG: GGDEF domain-containing protein [Psychrobium sp.]|nr:GGDEF domain-containing protein [Psychrobium sp.]
MNFNALTNICPDPIIGVDRRGVINLFNASAEQVLGYHADDVIGKINICKIYASAKDARRVKRLMYEEDNGGLGKLCGIDIQLRCIDDSLVPVRLSAAAIIEDDVETGSIGFFHDLTKHKALESELKLLSITDGLSGLFNHRHFHAEIQREFERSVRSNHSFSLFCLDLDSFKLVNDILGHSIGDVVIGQVASILKKSLRSCDSAFRYGGDEFMVMLPETSLESAWQVAERVRKAFNELATQYYIRTNEDQNTVIVTMSIGLTILQKDDSVADIINRADNAMYHSKRDGGNRITTFDDAVEMASVQII